MNTIYSRVQSVGVLPVVAFSDVNQALAACKALAQGGIEAVEITFRTDAAADCIRAVRQAMPDFLVGAGSVVTLDMAKLALDAGAQFLVTPGFSAEIVEFALANRTVIFPGCSGATDMMAASRYALPVVKFFPAENLGGLPMLKALSAPFPKLRFMPTGGLKLSNLSDWLTWDRIFACGGSWLVQKDWLQEENYDAITDAARRTVEKLREVRG